MKEIRLENLLELPVLVIGEVGIDEYIWGQTHRISPEAPVPVVEVIRQEKKLGLSANVAQNIASLGGSVTLLSLLGEDEAGEEMQDLCKKQGLSHSHFIKDSSRPTLKKIRVLAQNQHIVRIDHEKVHRIAGTTLKKIQDKIWDLLPSHKGVIIQDYGKGFWIPETFKFVQEAKKLNIPVFVDPNRHTPLAWYKDTTLMTPNILEAKILTGYKDAESDNDTPLGNNSEALKNMAQMILDSTGSAQTVITCGEWGMIYLTDKGVFHRVPTYAKKVFDVTGAGDTVIAVLSLMYLEGLPLEECIRVANAAAGIVVERMGTSSVTKVELLERLKEINA